MTAMTLPVPSVNNYLAYKQHLLPHPDPTDVVQVIRDVVALHATAAAGPYLSLWARVPGFQRQALHDALYEHHALAKVLCMRRTLHVVPGDHVPAFFQAYVERHTAFEAQQQKFLLVETGLSEEAQADAVLAQLHRRVLDLLAEHGPSTANKINRAIPELGARFHHSEGKKYAGTFSVGSRLIPSLCTLGLLIRGRPRGTWRSNLHEYAILSDWLPDVDLASVTPPEAQAWLVRRYLAAFGPTTPDDVQWWTGFSKGETRHALEALGPAVTEVSVESLGDEYLMLADDAGRLRDFAPPDAPYVSFLPSLDPYIMGYRDRRRFLAPEHRTKVFDRAGNATPTVWANGQVVGAWGQHKQTGSVVYGLFEPVSQAERALLQTRRRELEKFLGGEYLPPYARTRFTRALPLPVA
jgi:hypothetical protein